jgi:6-phosphogluconolactonase (cycloisomerase 2 family)
VLYAVHAVAIWNNLPCGAVSAYLVERSTGRLQLLNTVPLSLSATSPRHGAVTLDGRYLVVAAPGGGSYNVLPIASDGALGAPEGIRKELGRVDGSINQTAQPRQVILHPNGSALLTADSGNESIHSFDMESGSLLLRNRLRVHPGAGPSQIAVSRCGRWIYAMNAADGSIDVHPLQQPSGHIASASQRIVAGNPGPALMAMHPAGGYLVTAGAEDRAASLATYYIGRQSGRLHVADAALHVDTPMHRDAHTAIAFSPCGSSLATVSATSGQVVQSTFDAQTGAIRGGKIVAQVAGASCVSL